LDLLLFLLSLVPLPFTSPFLLPYYSFIFPAPYTTVISPVYILTIPFLTTITLNQFRLSFLLNFSKIVVVVVSIG
jgi:hypothetical protein